MEKRQFFLVKAIFIIAIIFFCDFVEAEEIRVINRTSKLLMIKVDGIEKQVLGNNLTYFNANGSELELTIKNGNQIISISKKVDSRKMIIINDDDLITVNSSQQSPMGTILSVSNNQTQTSGRQAVGTPTSYNNIATGVNVKVSYIGNYRFKIISQTGYGLEFKNGDEESIFVLDKTKDIILGIALLRDSSDQGIFYYAEIKKRLPAENGGSFLINDNDVKIMSEGETNIKVSLDADGYKVFFRNGNKAVSLGHKDISGKIKAPVGQFFFRLSFTDKDGKFQRSVLVPKHITDNENRLIFTKKDLDNAIQLNW